VGLLFDVVSQQDRFDRRFQLICQFPGLADQLQRYGLKATVNLLGNDPNGPMTFPHLY
jgi:hypothetical protein